MYLIVQEEILLVVKDSETHDLPFHPSKSRGGRKRGKNFIFVSGNPHHLSRSTRHIEGRREGGDMGEKVLSLSLGFLRVWGGVRVRKVGYR